MQEMVEAAESPAALITRMTIKELSEAVIISKAEEAKKVEIGDLLTVKDYLKRKAEEAEKAKDKEKKAGLTGHEEKVAEWPSFKKRKQGSN